MRQAPSLGVHAHLLQDMRGRISDLWDQEVHIPEEALSDLPEVQATDPIDSALDRFVIVLGVVVHNVRVKIQALVEQLRR